MFAQETLLARGFGNREEALSPLVAALPHWKNIRGTLRPGGGALVCSAPFHGRSGAFRYPARVLLRTESDSSVSVVLRLQRVTRREAGWLVLSFLFFPALCVYPDARHIGIGIALDFVSGFARAAMLFHGAERCAGEIESIYRLAAATRHEARR